MEYDIYIGERIAFNYDDIILTNVEIEPFQMKVNFKYETEVDSRKMPKGVEVTIEDDKGNVWSERNSTGHQNGSSLHKTFETGTENLTSLQCNMSVLLESPIFKESDSVSIKELKVNYIEYPDVFNVDLKNGEIKGEMKEHFSVINFEDSDNYYSFEVVKSSDVDFKIRSASRGVIVTDKSGENSWTRQESIENEDGEIEYYKDGWQEKENHISIDDYEKLRLKILKSAFEEGSYILSVNVEPPIESETFHKNIKIWDRNMNKDEIEMDFMKDITKLFNDDKNMRAAVDNWYITEFETPEEGSFKIKYGMRDSRNLVLIADIEGGKNSGDYENLWIKDFRLDSKYGFKSFNAKWVKIDSGGVIRIIDDFKDFNDFKRKYSVHGRIYRRLYNEWTRDYDNEEVISDIRNVEVDLDLLKKSKPHKKELMENLSHGKEDILLTGIEIDKFQMILDFQCFKEAEDMRIFTPNLYLQDEKGNTWTQKEDAVKTISVDGKIFTIRMDSPMDRDSDRVYLKELSFGYRDKPDQMLIDFNDGKIDEKMKEYFKVEEFTEEEDGYVIELSPKSETHFDLGKAHRVQRHIDVDGKESWSSFYDVNNKDTTELYYLSDEWHLQEGYYYSEDYERIRIKVRKGQFGDGGYKKVLVNVYSEKKILRVNPNLKIWDRKED